MHKKLELLAVLSAGLMPLLAQSSDPADSAPVINYFYVAPASTLPGQAAVATLSVGNATSATVNGMEAFCNNGTCTANIPFYPSVTTTYTLQVSGTGGSASASQQVEVGHYQPNPTPVPAGLQITWQGACWMKHCAKQGACQGMAFSVNVPKPPASLPLEATLYLGSTTCNPSSEDNLNDLGTLTGSGGWIFWFSHHPNRPNSSAIWTFGNQSSGCVSYAKAPACQ